VAYVPWRVAPVDDVELDVDVAEIYGPQFVEALGAAPASAFVAEGSDVLVRWGNRLTQLEPSAPRRPAAMAAT
jgi:hypothetical protein